VPSAERRTARDGPRHVLVDSTGLKIYGVGQWLEEKHSAKSRRGWRKLHLLVDADSAEIIAHSLTDKETGDASQVKPLLDQIDDEIGQFTADGAYNGAPTYEAVLHHRRKGGHSTALECNWTAQHLGALPARRPHRIHPNRWSLEMAELYRLRQAGADRNSHGRYKGIIGPRLRARSFRAQQAEAAIGVTILNRMLVCGRPKSIRCEASTAATK